MLDMQSSRMINFQSMHYGDKEESAKDTKRKIHENRKHFGKVLIIEFIENFRNAEDEKGFRVPYFCVGRSRPERQFLCKS